MRSRWLATLLVLVSITTAASADILVLRSEGRADKKVRTTIEAAILKLAKAGGSATAGDITYGDAATMVGCKPEEAACKAEVLNMLAVEEIVTITASPKPGGFDVTVQRIKRGGATASASASTTTDKPDDLDAIGYLFGASGPPSPLPPPVAVTPTSPPTTIDPLPPIATTPEPSPEPAPIVPPPTRVGEPTPSIMSTTPEQPLDRDEPPNRRRRLQMAGMAGGGALLLIGVVLWASANSIEDEIASAPNRTRADLDHIKDLERQGDGYANAGNLLVIGGLVLGGVSTYYYLKGRKRSSHSAHITPTVVPGGAGVVFTFGGTP